LNIFNLYSTKFGTMYAVMQKLSNLKLFTQFSLDLNLIPECILERHFSDSRKKCFQNY
jgi:hypothetical protein